MNNVQLVGRLARDPQISYATTGTTIAKFTVACDRKFKDQGADFIPCTAFSKTAEFIEKYFSKGQRIGINGHIQTGSYTNRDGATVYTTDVIVEGVEFVEGKKSNSRDDGSNEFMNIPEDSEEGTPFD